jgi:hypothetical protein
MPANNKVKTGRFIVEPPTLKCLGFEWYIDGDDNRNAGVEVSYREKGAKDWKKALPLLRVQNEDSSLSFLFQKFDYIAPNLFAGSIFDLKEDTEYECRFVMSDPDGVTGEAQKTVTVRTRPEPKPFAGGNVYHVYPREYTGAKQEPNFVSLLAAYCTGWCEADWWAVNPPRVKPGDTIVMHAGVYKDDWNFYGGDIWGQGQGTPFQGTYYLTAKGTADKPIAIVAAGDGEVVFDGNGNFNLFNMMSGDYHYFEGIAFRNTYVAILAGQKDQMGCSGLTVKRCRFENIDKGIHNHWSGSKNFYIADNIFIGRHNPDRVEGWTNLPPRHDLHPYGKNLSEYAVKICGSGNVVCHNYVAYFHDGIDHATYGVPDGYPRYGNPDVYPLDEVLKTDHMLVSNDIYNNFIFNMHDDFIEADGGMYNQRVFNNLCINTGTSGLSAQPLLGGPAYYIRNILYNVPKAIKHAANPSGMFYYHNTFITKVNGIVGSNYHLRNNLVLGWLPKETLYLIDTFTNYTTSDYNGFNPDPAAETSFIWKSPPFDKLRDFKGERQERKYANLGEYTKASGQDKHSVLVDYGIFNKVAPVTDVTKVYKREDLDFRLKPGSAAVDAGCVLPNINDGFTGKAPDLGALELGQPLPVYGPRPADKK